MMCIFSSHAAATTDTEIFVASSDVQMNPNVNVSLLLNPPLFSIQSGKSYR